MTDKEKLFCASHARVIKAMAHPSRLWILRRLSEGERCVCELVDGLGADFSTVSRHLAVLRQAGIISDDKRGKQIFYRLRVPCVLKFMDCVSAVIREQAEDRKAVI